MRGIGRLLGALLVACLLAAPVHGQEEAECPVRKGWNLTESELQAKLAEHEGWLEHGGQGPGRANFCNADLRGADLRGAKLSRANLGGANLTGAYLREANLSGANLSGADLHLAILSLAILRETNLSGANLHLAILGGAYLSRANLSGADLGVAMLRGADLSGANLTGANLSEAKLGEARFVDADLRGANLSRAELRGTDLNEAKLTAADFTDAVYEPIGTVPAKGFLSAIKGLSTVRFDHENESGLVLLREVLRASGLRQLEREATFAIEHGRARHKRAGHGVGAEYDAGMLVGKDLGAQIEGILKLVFFEWTTGYGLNAGRSLLILVALIGVMALCYLVPLLRPDGQGGLHGIYRVWPKGRIEAGDDGLALVDDERVERLTVKVGSALMYGLYFSLLSAFHIGWRDLNAESWLTRIQSREYVLRGRGWVRVVSGLQSLASIYLLAMWALTFFARPFQ